MKQEAKLSLG